MSEEEQKDSPLSTTVVGLEADDGVVVCADRQVSGRRILETDKLKKVHPNAVLGTAGLVTDIQTLVRDLNTGIKEYKIRRGREMTVRALMEFTRDQINPGSGHVHPQYFSDLIVAGYDNDGGVVAELDHIGTKTTEPNYVTVGSGGPVARGVIASNYDSSMDVDEVRELGIKSLKVAAEEGVYTGVGVDVAVVTEDGVSIENGINIE